MGKLVSTRVVATQMPQKDSLLVATAPEVPVLSQHHVSGHGAVVAAGRARPDLTLDDGANGNRGLLKVDVVQAHLRSRPQKPGHVGPSLLPLNSGNSHRGPLQRNSRGLGGTLALKKV